MTTVRADATDAELAAAVEANLFAMFRAMAALPGSDFYESERLSYHLTFPSSPMFKGVWGTHLSDDEIDAAIETTIDWLKARNAPYAFWWVGSHAQPADLIEHLEAHGLTANVAGAPELTLDLTKLDANARLPEDTRIMKVADQQTLDDWRDAFCVSNGLATASGQAWIDATLTFGIEDAPWQLYLAYWQDRPAACSALYNGGGAAGLYAVGTIAEARGRGLGTAITRTPLLDARALGYRVGVLFSTDMGYPIYQRLGFHDTGHVLGRYIWRNS